MYINIYKNTSSKTKDELKSLHIKNRRLSSCCYFLLRALRGKFNPSPLLHSKEHLDYQSASILPTPSLLTYWPLLLA